MKENLGPKIIAAVVVLVMIVPIVIDVVSNSILKTIKYDEMTKIVSATSNYDAALIYVASSENEDLKDKKSEIKGIVRNYKSAANKDVGAYYLDYENLSSSKIAEIFGENSDERVAYVFAVNGEIIKTVSGELSEEKLTDLVEFYSANAENISEDLIRYKEPKNAKEFNSLAKDKNKVNMFVFGRDSCFYCNQFKIVYNTVIEEYNLDSIFYIDSDKYDSEEYQKIMDSGLKIPAKCNNTGEEVTLQQGFGTPLTLFTKNGKVIDCIQGYVSKKNLTTQLKTVGIIKDETAE